MRLTFFQKIQSFFYPLLVRRDSTSVNPVLELYYYRGRWQLATADALYSDGAKYRPLRAAYRALKQELPRIKHVLVLGTGLGSAVHIMDSMGYHPAFTLIELDEKILGWAMALMSSDTRSRLNPVCADAATFLETTGDRYDLIIIDVFEGRFVPAFVTTADFLVQCKKHLLPQGCVVMNYMVTGKQDEQKVKAAVEAAFGIVDVLAFHLNRLFIAKA